MRAIFLTQTLVATLIIYKYKKVTNQPASSAFTCPSGSTDMKVVSLTFVNSEIGEIMDEQRKDLDFNSGEGGR